MKKIILPVLGLFAMTVNVQAQETRKVDASVMAKADEKKKDGWDKKGVTNLNFGQVGLQNWAGGGQSSISGTALISLAGNYKKGKTAWDNSLDLAYGLVKLGKENIQKSDDKIELNSKYGRQIGESNKFFYGGLVNFRSQFDDGYATPAQVSVISKFMSPAYLTAALGIDYKPNKYVSVFLAPVSSRTTFVLDNVLNSVGAYGVDTNSTYRAEFGGLLMAKYSRKIMKNVSLTTQATFFSNYSEEPQNIDVLLDLILDMKINKYISASVSLTSIYDHDIMIGLDTDNDGINDSEGQRLQLKDVISVGFKYTF